MYTKQPTRRPTPPLTWLRSFESAARHCSFKKAAEELHVTPAAISQQIRQLEAYYGTKLFTRQPGSIGLTRIGKLTAPLVQMGFKSLTEACCAIESDRNKEALVVTVPPSFCIKWLVPRLDRFQDRHPGIEVRIDARDELVNFNAGLADVGVRYGDGNYPDLHVEPLVRDAYWPVCSPQLLQRTGGLDHPSQIVHYRLLHVDWPALSWEAPSWDMWLKAAKTHHPDLEKGHRFANEMMAQDAAVSGLGLALASQANAAIDLADGRLVRVLENIQPANRQFQYYLVRAKAVPPPESAALFCDWLREEGKRYEAASSCRPVADFAAALTFAPQ